MKKILLLLTSLAFLQIGFSQVTIHQESFESAPLGTSTNYSASSEFGSSDPNDYWGRIDITGNGKDEINAGVTNGDGSKMYAGEDISSIKVLTIKDVNVSAYTSIKVKALFGAGEQNKYDIGDYIKVFVKKDAGSEVLIGAFYGRNFNIRMHNDVDLDGSISVGEEIAANKLGKALKDFTFDVSGSFSNLQVIIKMFTSSGDEVAIVDNVRIIGTSSGPSITATPISLTGFTYVELSGPSAEQSFDVEGSSLTNDIDVTPPFNWEISLTSGGPYQTTAITLAESGGTVNSTTIYTRMVSGLLNTNSPFSGNITNVSSGATTVDVAVDGTVTLPCIAPTTDASIPSNSAGKTTATIDWTNGNGSNRIVVLKESSAVTFVPTDNTSYTANSAFGTGTDVGTGEYVVYNGNSNSVSTTSLTPGTEYFSSVYEYNCLVGAEKYFTSGLPLTDNFLTEPNNPSLSVGCISNTTIDLSWTPPAVGNSDGYLLVVRENANPHAVTSLDPNTALGDDLNYSIASTYGSTSPNSRILYNGVGTAVTVTGLTQGISYKFKLFAFASNGTLYEYSTGTLTTQTINLLDVSSESTSTGFQQLDVAWANPLSPSCYDEIMIVANETAGISFAPTGNGSGYIANSVYAGINSIVYKGTGTAVTVTGLTNGTTYYFEIFVRKGLEWSQGVETFGTPSTATILDGGDLAIVAINTQYAASPSSDDEICFFAFKDITLNTAIDFTDNGFERVNAGLWGETEGTIRIERTSGADIAKGTVVCIQGSGHLSANFDIYVCGVLDNANWTITSLNGNYDFNLNPDDQIWILQGGNWTNPSGTHNAEYSGNLLYGWTATGWEPNPGYADSKGSTLPDYTTCINTNVSGTTNKDKVKYTGPTTITSQNTWIGRINDDANWTGYSSNANYNSGGSDYSGSCVVFNIDNSSGFTAGVWEGDEDNNWYNCGNWQNFKVPDETVDVTILTSATNEANFNNGNTDADLYDNVAKCKNLTIETVIYVEGDTDMDTLKVFGNLVIEDDAALYLDNAAAGAIMELGGNFTNNDPDDDAFIQDKSTVILNGTGQQDVTTAHSSNKEDFYNLIVKKTAQTKVNLNDDIEISNVLTFESGIIKTNTSEVYVSTGNLGDIVGYEAPNGTGTYTNDKYVEGNLAREISSAAAYEFPVGDDATAIGYNPVVLTVSSGTGKAIGKFVGSNPGTITVNDATKTCTGSPVLIHYSTMTGLGYWNFSSATSFNYNIMLHPNTANTNTDPNSDGQYRALKAPSGTAGGTWPAISGTNGDWCAVSSNYYSIPGEGYSGFSDFGVGGGTSGPALPVELLFFDAEPKGNTILTSWATATEINNDYFTIERSKNGIDFEEIGKVKGAGNYNNKKNYDFTDENPFNGISYYRLKQTDFDGTFAHSHIVVVSLKSSRLEIGELYPNPTTNELFIPISVEETDVVNVVVTDLLGQIVIRKQLTLENLSIINISTNDFATGTYLLKIETLEGVYSRMFVKK